ncbi:LOW QUALITY PROTEIN: uncharacterized protein FYN16_006647 [Cariama cristata]
MDTRMHTHPVLQALCPSRPRTRSHHTPPPPPTSSHLPMAQLGHGHKQLPPASSRATEASLSRYGPNSSSLRFLPQHQAPRRGAPPAAAKPPPTPEGSWAPASVLRSGKPPQGGPQSSRYSVGLGTSTRLDPTLGTKPRLNRDGGALAIITATTQLRPASRWRGRAAAPSGAGHQPACLHQDPLPKLKDLAFLKDQLESLQRRVEDEVHAGGQDGSLLASPFLKGFLAGYLVAKLRFSAVLGFVAGTCTGICAQNYTVPGEKTVRDYFSSLKKGTCFCGFWRRLVASLSGISALIAAHPAGYRLKMVMLVMLLGSANWMLQRGLWGLMLVLSVAIYGSHAPLLTQCKVDGMIPFNSTSVVVLVELTKLLFSLLFLLTWDRELLGVAVSWRHIAPFAPPASSDAANNNLVVHLQLFMDPSTYQVLSNLKIVSTALLYSLFLRQRLSMRKWLALLLLVAAGVSYSCGGLQDPGSPSKMQLHITLVGLLLISVYWLISGLSAVYTEAILKTQALPLSLQNLFLYVFGVLLNLIGYFWSSTEGSFLEGFSSWVLVIVVSQALNGLIMSVVMKHSSNITRLFVISCSILVNALLSVTLHLQLTTLFFIAVSCIGLAVHLYYGVT